MDGLDSARAKGNPTPTQERKEPKHNELFMTLADLVNKARDCGNSFSSWYIPLLKDGQPFEIDFEAEGSNDEGWQHKHYREMKRNRKFDELVANIPEETMRRVEKAMSCKWLRHADECGKGLPGTLCEVVGCVAWEHYKDNKK